MLLLNFIQSIVPTQAQIDEILALQNLFRTNAKLDPDSLNALPAFTWDENLAKTAQGWAEQCNFNHDTGANRAIPGKLILTLNFIF